MATNDYGSAPETGANEMGGEGGGESLRCLHIYEMADGSFTVKQTEGESAPEGAEPVADLGGVMAMVEETFAATEDPEEMAAVERGYNKGGKKPPLQAPNPGGLFGE